MTDNDEFEQATRVRDGGGGTVEVEIEKLEEINQLLAEAMEKANTSVDDPIRASRAIALSKTEEAHMELAEIIPGWHSVE